MRKLLILIMLFTATTASAQQFKIEKFEVWKDSSPPHTSTLNQPQGVNGSGHVTNCQTAAVELYLPQGAAKKCVVICPGGGYGILAIEHEGRQFAELLARSGIAAAVLSYRMPNGVHQIPMEDVQQTFKILRAKSAQFGINPDKIGIMGFSAGGHLASTASVRLKPSPAFSVLFYPVISFKDGLTHGGSRKNLTGGDTTLYEYYSNELQATGETPPALLFHSQDDKTVPIENSKLYYAALRDKHVDAKFVEYATGGHGWGFNKSYVQHDDMKNELIEWLSKR